MRLTLYPGRMPQPGEEYEAKTAVFGVGAADSAEHVFAEYVARYGHRGREPVSMGHCYGVHDFASMANPVSLTEEMVANTLDVLAECQQRGVRFDWYWIDAGWYDPTGDIKDFDSAHFANGPAKVFERIEALGMKAGLWTSPVCGPMAFNEGKGVTNPLLSEPGCMCVAEGAWSAIYQEALLYHVRGNGVRGFKFDGVNLVCNFAGSTTSLRRPCVSTSPRPR